MLKWKQLFGKFSKVMQTPWHIFKLKAGRQLLPESLMQRLLDENKGNGYLLSVDGTPHCIAYWDTARDAELTGKAELICIHSLPENWHKGYGRQMMNRVLKDIKENGYSEVFLWVFRENYRARAFYEANGFALTDTSKPAFDTEEVLYSKRI